MKRIALILTFALMCPSAFADCPRPAGTQGRGIAGQSDQQRLDFLKTLATREVSHISTWKLLSGGAFAALVVGQLAIAPLFEPSVRPDYYWGAGYSALGLASTLVGAPAVFEHGAEFAAHAAAATPETVCAIIAEGEALIAKSATDEVLPTRWFIHALNVAVNLSLGAILGFGYGHWTNATINTVAGIAISETVLFTKPHASIAGWREYTSGGDEPVSLQLRVSPAVNGGLTVGLGGTF